MPKKIFLAALFLSVGFYSVSWSQITTGSIRGVVIDTDGKPIPGANVTISSVSLIGTSRTTTTNELGVFRFPALPVGSYSVGVTLESFEPIHVEKVQVGLDTNVNLPLTMKLSSMSESLTVTGEAPVIDVTNSGLSTTYSKEILENVPTTRTFTDLMQVAPGISPSTGDSQGTRDRTVAFGSNIQSNSWNVDGLEMTAPETGSTWLYQNPDAIEEIQILGVGAPAEYGNHTGAVFNVVTKKGGNAFHGGANYFFQDEALTGVNITLPDVVPEKDSHFNRVKYHDASAQLGGPIAKDRLWFFGSFQYVRDAASDPGVPPAFATEDKNTRYDIKGSGLLGEKYNVTGFYQFEDWADPDPGSPFFEPSAVYQERGKNWAWGAGVTSALNDSTLFEAHYAGWSTDDFHDSPTGTFDTPFIDFTPSNGDPIFYSGASYYPFDYKTNRNQVNGKVTYYAENFLKSQHEFRFGVQYSQGKADTAGVAAGPNGFYDYHYGSGDYSYYYRVYQLPFQYGANTKGLGAFLDDTVTVNSRLTLNLGVRFDHNTGDIPSFDRLAVGTPSFTPVGNFVNTGVSVPGVHVMTWNNVSPRLGLTYQATQDGRSVLQGSFGVYYDHNVSGNWDSPSPSETPVDVFQFNPETGLYDIPISHTEFSPNFDPNIKPPRTLQYSVGYEQQFSQKMAAGIQYVYKDTKDLIGWEMIGGEWQQVPFTDPFTGNQYTLLNQISPPLLRKGNEPFPEGIPNFSGETEPYFQKYHAVVVTFSKNFSNNWALNASYTWSKSTGLIPRMLSQDQFNPFYSNREGSDPNNYINAEGRLQGDRPNMFRVQGVFNNLPWGLQVSTGVDFSSGKEHTRQIQVALDQGLKDVIMQRDLRLSSFKNIDVTIARPINLGREMQVRLEGTIYNVLNSDNDLVLATQTLDQVGDQFVPTQWQRPRRLQIRVGFQF